MSPWGFDGDRAEVGYVYGLGYVDSDVYSYIVFGVRPAINLSSYVEITSGDGTIDNPYVVK